MAKKRVQLKTKTEKKISKFPNLGPLFFSGDCLSDNLTFAIFFVDNKFLIDNQIETSKIDFKLNINDLNMSLDKANTLKYKQGNEFVNFESFGLVSKELFSWFRYRYPKCVFCPITEFFGNKTNTLIAVLHEEYGKPIGVLKTT